MLYLDNSTTGNRAIGRGKSGNANRGAGRARQQFHDNGESADPVAAGARYGRIRRAAQARDAGAGAFAASAGPRDQAALGARRGAARRLPGQDTAAEAGGVADEAV